MSFFEQLTINAVFDTINLPKVNKKVINMKRVIGLTGGVASGKSTVSKFFKKLGAKIINVDEIGHLILKKPEVIKLIDNEFLNVLENGEVSRIKLGNLVFSNPMELKKLNDIMYPRMKKIITDTIEDGINILDMAILFESGFDNLCESVIVVSTLVETQIERMERRYYNSDKITGILNSQMDTLDKSLRADFVINNDDSKELLKNKVENLYKHILENK